MLRASANSLMVTSVYGNGEGNAETNDKEFHISRVPSCTLLEVDGLKVLLDCGWDPEFSACYIEALLPLLPQVDAVLLSSPEFSCCGALPVAVKYLRAQVPVYTTIACGKLALLCCISQYQARHANVLKLPLEGQHAALAAEAREDQLHRAATGEDYDDEAQAVPGAAPQQQVLKITVDDIYHAFNDLHDAPYGGVAKLLPLTQQLELEDQVQQGGGAHDDGSLLKIKKEEHGVVEVVAQSFRAGRVLGACGWRLQYQTDDIIYVPKFTIQSSAHLKGMELQAGAIHLKGNLLITDASPLGVSPALDTVSTTEDKVIRQVEDDLRRGRTILLPVESCGRGVEVLLSLDRMFESRALHQNYTLVFAFSKSRELLDRVKTLTEFLAEKSVADDFLSRVKFAKTAQEALSNEHSGGGATMSSNAGRVIIADGLSLEDGLAAELMVSVMGMSKGSVVFTSAPPPGSQAAKLAALGTLGKPLPAGKKFSGHIWKRRQLQGQELEDYYDRLEAERLKEAVLLDEAELQQQQQQLLLGNSDAANGGGDGLDSDDDDDGMPNQSGGGAGFGVSATAGGASSKHKLHLPRHLQFESKHLMFPNTHKEREFTPYGVPLKAFELRRMRRVVPLRVFTDAGPEDQTFESTARVEDALPTAVHKEKFTIKSCTGVTVRVYKDFVQEVDAESFCHLFRTHFKNVRRVVFTKGSGADSTKAMAFADAELSGGRAARAFKTRKFVSLQNMLQSEQMAVAIQSYDVRLEQTLANETKSQLRQVREDHGGMWEVGWVAGLVTHQHGGGGGTAGGGVGTHQDRNRKRNRDDDRLPFLIPMGDGTDGDNYDSQHRSNNYAAAPKRESNLEAGSVFIGQVDLSAMKESLRPRDVKTHGKAPMMIVDGSSYIRVPGSSTTTTTSGGGTASGHVTGNDVTIEHIASHTMYKVREQVYKHFSQIL